GVTRSGGMEFADAGGARDCGGDSSCSDRRAAASLGYLKKNCAFDKIHLPRAFFETENRVGAEASDGLIVESQFDARLRASANSGAMADKIAERDRAWCLFSEQRFNVIHYLGDARCLQFHAVCRSGDGDRPNKG